jgi:hypothetical protein
MKKLINSLFGAHERISYRRLMAFTAATCLLCVDRLNGDQWVYICVAFIAGEAAPKMVAALKGN